MTDEEKAEKSYVKYRNAKCKITRNSKNNHLHKDWRESGVDRHKAYIDGYLDGLAEGKKEVYELFNPEVDDIAKDYEERLKKFCF